MNKTKIEIQELNGGGTQKSIDIRQVIVVGYGGRDVEKVHEHIKELEDIGVAPPVTIPELYPQKLEALTTDQKIQVQGKETSGEVEYVLVHDGTEWLVTVGSDHTDRKMETISVLLSKAACVKPMSTTFWRLRDLEDHWDQLVLRSYMTIDGSKRLYQEHDLTALLPVSVLLEKLQEFGYEQLSNTVIFSGTVPTIGGFVYGSEFEYELEDPVLNRCIKGSYTIVVDESNLHKQS